MSNEIFQKTAFLAISSVRLLFLIMSRMLSGEMKPIVAVHLGVKMADTLSFTAKVDIMWISCANHVSYPQLTATPMLYCLRQWEGFKLPDRFSYLQSVFIM